MPHVPQSLGIPLYKGCFWGLCLLKTMPQPRPNSAPYKNLMLAFAYTRTVVWANAHGCLG
jgi:hypothetical protein